MVFASVPDPCPELPLCSRPLPAGPVSASHPLQKWASLAQGCCPLGHGNSGKLVLRSTQSKCGREKYLEFFNLGFYVKIAKRYTEYDWTPTWKWKLYRVCFMHVKGHFYPRPELRNLRTHDFWPRDRLRCSRQTYLLTAVECWESS